MNEGFINEELLTFQTWLGLTGTEGMSGDSTPRSRSSTGISVPDLLPLPSKSQSVVGSARLSSSGTVRYSGISLAEENSGSFLRQIMTQQYVTWSKSYLLLKLLFVWKASGSGHMPSLLSLGFT